MIALETTIIEQSLLTSFNYIEYRETIKNLLKKDLSTGPTQSEDLLNFSLLNDKRMDRLDKKLIVFEEFKEEFKNLSKKYTLLVIAEGWCGDAAQTLPILNKIAETSENINLKIVLRDENEDLMNMFLTNGSKSIPKVIILNEDNNVLNTWGPRPQVATQMVTDYKAKHGVIDAEFKKNLQVWYNKDKGFNTQCEILELLKRKF